jgi:hypothetical protein
MKNFLLLMTILWFVFGMSAANDRGFFASGYPRTCTNVGTAALTVVGGPLFYAGVRPRAFC